MATDHSWRVVFNPGAADDFFQTHRPDLFDSHAVGFSRVNAWWLSEFSRLIYRRDETEGVATIASRSAFLADHAPFNYTAQLPLTCGNR